MMLTFVNSYRPLAATTAANDEHTWFAAAMRWNYDTKLFCRLAEIAISSIPFLAQLWISRRESCPKRENEGVGGKKLTQFQTIVRSQNAVASNFGGTYSFVRLCSYIEKHAVVSLRYPRIKPTWSSAHLPEHLGAVINVARLIEQRPLYASC